MKSGAPRILRVAWRHVGGCQHRGVHNHGRDEPTTSAARSREPQQERRLVWGAHRAMTRPMLGVRVPSWP